MLISAKILQMQISPFKFWWWQTLEIDYTSVDYVPTDRG